MNNKPRVAFVVQRCGPEVNGGAEAHCLQMAQRMAAWWETEVLTTCALDYVTWGNHYSPGESRCGATTIRRFPVAYERNNDAFDRLSAQLHAKQRLSTQAEQQEWMRAQGPVSPELTAYIRQFRGDYDAFVFFGYLYATTFDNLPLVAEKAWLAPLAHDEWPLYFSMFDRLFAKPRGFLFNTVSERDFLRERFFHLDLQGPVAGVGIEAPVDVDARRFRRNYRLDQPFLLYCGRIDPSKGCAEMFDGFLAWKQKKTSPLKLVLLGKPVMPIPDHPDLVSLGFVTDADKWDAMAACQWLLMPSPYESLSMVLLEAWAVKRPALVNAKCRVLVDHCTQSRGGIPVIDWEQAFANIEGYSASQETSLGDCGYRYVKGQYTWDRVCAKYTGLLATEKISS